MRRPQVLSPMWFVLITLVVGLGGVLAEWLDVSLWADEDETFQWSDVALFAVVMFALQIGFALWTRHQQRAQGLG